MTTIPATTIAVPSRVAGTQLPTEPRSSFFVRVSDRRRQASEARRTRRAVARAMADAPTAAGRAELQVLLLP